MTGLDSRVLLAPDDGSLGPLLRLADDRLAPGVGYGRHAHREVDVVAVVLAGSLAHRWGDGARIGAGDVGVLRAGTGLEHDEVAGPDGAHVLQCYLRTTRPDAGPAHEVRAAVSGWVELGRPDARLWTRRTAPGEPVEVPPGLLILADGDEVRAEPQPGGAVRTAGAGTALVWQLDTSRPAWASD
ncbi:MAG TPA: pirin family protein [Geodermatophilus sp.]|nr:pirin family protein [Geodermatophilus sp.]